jgi:ankyrin repeat protein
MKQSEPRASGVVGKLLRRVVLGVVLLSLAYVLFLVVIAAGIGNEDPLVVAVGARDMEQVVHFLEQGADPNHLDWSGESAFHVAAEDGYFDVMVMLYEAGADPHRLTAHGDSVLTLVANHSGDVEIARWLLDHGVDPCIPPSDWISDILGLDTIMEIAANRGHDDLVVLLEQATADCPVN